MREHGNREDTCRTLGGEYDEEKGVCKIDPLEIREDMDELAGYIYDVGRNDKARGKSRDSGDIEELTRRVIETGEK